MGVANEVRKEVDELLERLTTDEMEDLLEQLRKRFKQERDKLEKELDRVNGQIQGYLKSLNALKQET